MRLVGRPLLLLPGYWIASLFPAARETARRIGLVTLEDMLRTRADAIISINTPENLGQTTPTQSFTTYLGLPVNDIAWNPVDGLIYATVASSGGQGLGNSLVGIDPNTGTIQKTIFVGSEPNRLALSTDGTQAFVGLNGAGAVRQDGPRTRPRGPTYQGNHARCRQQCARHRLPAGKLAA